MGIEARAEQAPRFSATGSVEKSDRGGALSGPYAGESGEKNLARDRGQTKSSPAGRA
jgi:hypothetical protein